VEGLLEKVTLQAATVDRQRWSDDAADCSKHGQQRPETLGRRQSTTVDGE